MHVIVGPFVFAAAFAGANFTGIAAKTNLLFHPSQPAGGDVWRAGLRLRLGFGLRRGVGRLAGLRRAVRLDQNLLDQSLAFAMNLILHLAFAPSIHVCSHRV